MFVCPTCDRVFDSGRGRAIHHAAAHDELLPNRECTYCNGSFYSEHERKYCSEECLENAAPYAGESNPNFKGGKEETECVLCGDHVEYYPSEKEGLYCACCVENETWQTPPGLAGEHNPNWNGGMIEHPCDVCGEPVERWPSEFADSAVLCGESCRQTWLSDAFTGEGHPNWKGGDPGPYGKGWASVRRRALERDDYECQVCGQTRAELGRNPDVHHIVPVRSFIEADDHEKTDAHTLGNVISLCVRCHRQADVGNISRERLRTLLSDP